MKYFYFGIILCFTNPMFCQSLEKNIAQSLDTLTELFPQEKIYVHLNKETHSAGETIWFKTYVTLDGKPSFLSKVIYVELVNAEGEIVEKRMYKLENGTAAGDITLKEKQAGGTYVINAYTMWMLNFPGKIFSKHLFIYNTGIKKTTADIGKLQVNFFPEGGILLTNVASNLAFKAIAHNGLPADISGKIVDSKNNVVTKFATLHGGMGSFLLKPGSGEKYTAIVALENGINKSFLLPASVNEGISISVSNNNPAKIFVRVDRAELNKAIYNELIVVAIIHGRLAYIGKLNIDEGLDAVSISKKNLPPGIMQIFVIDKNNLLLLSRQVFINNQTMGENIINNSGFDPGKRKINEISLSLHKMNKPELSASVINSELAMNKQNSDNIISSLLLNSDLDGYIHESAAYFRDTFATTLKALDLLMLTTKSTRFDFNKIFKRQFPKLVNMVESGISISGKAVKSGTHTELKAGRINIWVKGDDSTSILSEAIIDTKGLFFVPGLEFRKSAKILYQGTSIKKENAMVEVKVFPSFFDTLKTAHARPLVDLNPYLDPYPDDVVDKIINKLSAREAINTKVLQEVKVSGRKKSAIDSLNQDYASDLFQMSDQSFSPDTNTNYFDIWQLLRGRIPGLSINRTDTGTEVNFGRYSGLNQFGSGENSSVQFFLNEAPVTVDIVDFIQPGDVALIKAYSGATGIALGATRGAIAIYTIKGKSLRDWRRKGFDATEQSGFSLQKIFSSPDHSPGAPDDIPNDDRPTLTWQPNLKPDGTGKALIRFYNDDYAAKFTITLQGFDSEGNLFYDEKSN